MQIKRYSVNDKGLAEIKAFLAKKHKLGGDYFTPAMLRAWAEEAEFQIDEGNPASIEIRSFDSVSGHTEELTLSEEGLNCEIVKVDDPD